MKIPDLYRAAASRSPDGVALDYRRAPHSGVCVTWAELLERAGWIAAELDTSPVTAGARVAVVLADDPDLIAWLIALWDRGCVVVPVDEQWGPALRDGIVGHAQADWVLQAAHGAGFTLRARHARRSVGPEIPDDTAIIAYTSGSTSSPKGVVLTHDALVRAYQAAAARMPLLTDSLPRSFGATLRMSGLGVLGMNYLFAAALQARVSVLPELEVAGARTFWEQVLAAGTGLLYLVPAQLELLSRVAQAPPVPLRGVTCISGGAPLRPDLQATVQKSSGITILNAYGMTEVAFAAFLGRRAEHAQGANDIGPPVTVSARLRDTGTGRLVEGEGEGELEMGGPSLAVGYYDNAAATSEVFVDGWVRSGDIARRDAAGNYAIAGRVKHVVLKGGFTLHLDEVESFGLLVPGVTEVAAVPVPTSAGEDYELVAVVDADADLTAAQVHQELAIILGARRAPRRVLLSGSALPRTGQQKLDRIAVRNLWARLRSLDASR